MKALLESRFMQVALSGNKGQMSDVELCFEFENFQQDLRDLLMSDKGYLTIDFILRDLLALLEGVACSKKMSPFIHSLREQKPTSTPASPKMKND